MLLRNYGLHWRRDQVVWDRPKSKWSLPGREFGKKNAQVTNFSEQVGLYALYDANFSLVYFGQAGAGKDQHLFGRLRQHTNDHLAERWHRFSWFGMTGVKKDGELAKRATRSQGPQAKFLNQVEAVVIATCEPPNNLQGGRFSPAQKYEQIRDLELGITVEQMIERIHRSQFEAKE